MTAWLLQYAQRLQSDPGAGPERQRAMAAATPGVALRPAAVRRAVDCAREGDYGPARELLRAVQGDSAIDAEQPDGA